HKSHAANTLEEYIEPAKSDSVSQRGSVLGNGTLPYLLAVLTGTKVGIKIDPVSYTCSAEAIADVLSGTVPSFVDAYSFLRQYVEAGDLKLLAFYTEERLPDFPDVPVFNERYPGLIGSSQIGLMARRGTPPEILAKIS